MSKHMSHNSLYSLSNKKTNIVPFVFKSSLSPPSFSALTNRQWFCRKLHRRRLHWTARFPARPRIMRRSARYHEDDFERSIDYKNGFVVRRRIPRMPVGVGVDVDVDVDGPPIVGGEDLQLEQENIYSLPSFVVTEPPIMTTPNQGISEHSFIRRKPNPKRGIDPKELESLAVVLPYPTLAGHTRRRTENEIQELLLDRPQEVQRRMALHPVPPGQRSYARSEN